MKLQNWGVLLAIVLAVYLLPGKVLAVEIQEENLVNFEVDVQLLKKDTAQCSLEVYSPSDFSSTDLAYLDRYKFQDKSDDDYRIIVGKAAFLVPGKKAVFFSQQKLRSPEFLSKVNQNTKWERVRKDEPDILKVTKETSYTFLYNREDTGTVYFSYFNGLKGNYKYLNRVRNISLDQIRVGGRFFDQELEKSHKVYATSAQSIYFNKSPVGWNMMKIYNLKDGSTLFISYTLTLIYLGGVPDWVPHSGIEYVAEDVASDEAEYLIEQMRELDE